MVSQRICGSLKWNGGNKHWKLMCRQQFTYTPSGSNQIYIGVTLLVGGRTNFQPFTRSSTEDTPLTIINVQLKDSTTQRGIKKMWRRL